MEPVTVKMIRSQTTAFGTLLAGQKYLLDPEGDEAKMESIEKMLSRKFATKVRGKAAAASSEGEGASA